METTDPDVEKDLDFAHEPRRSARRAVTDIRPAFAIVAEDGAAQSSRAQRSVPLCRFDLLFCVLSGVAEAHGHPPEDFSQITQGVHTKGVEGGGGGRC